MPKDAPGTLPAAALLHRPVLEGALARMNLAHRADGRAAASLWSQCYFTTLIVPAAILTIGGRGGPRLGIADLRVSLCPASGQARAFHGAERPAEAGLVAAFAALTEDHLVPLIAVLAQAGGLSPRLLWENAGWAPAWTCATLGEARPDLRSSIERLLAPGGPLSAWPAQDAIRAHALAAAPYRRRLCCLRDRVPGFQRCPENCPAAEKIVMW